MESKWSEQEGHEDLGRWLMEIRRLPRTEKVKRVRLALQNRTYENEFVLDQTVERMSREVSGLP